MSDKVSVIINCYNQEKHLKQCLDSVLRQTYENWEVIFWNDNSTDKSANVFYDWMNKNEIEFSKAKYCTTRSIISNLLFKFPLGCTRWAAVYRSTGKYIALLDADDMWRSDKLEKQIKVFKNNPEVKLMFSDCWYLEPLGVKKTFHDDYPPLMSDPFLGLLTRYNFMPCCTLVFERKALFNVIGSPSHYTGNEDYDWLLKMTARYKSDYVSEPLAYYRVDRDWKSRTMNPRRTAGEIDCVRQALKYRNLSKKERLQVYAHMAHLYLKLIYKEIWYGRREA